MRYIELAEMRCIEFTEMACQKLTYNPRFEVLKGSLKKELTIKKSVLKEHSVYFYGFNGYEKDNEVSGNGNSYTTKFRQYDPRLGRWKSLDPRQDKYPGSSPYSAYLNSPISIIDRDGDTTARFTWDGKYVGWIADGNDAWVGRRENAIANKDASGKIISYSHEYFSFADPINDPQGLKSKRITHLVFVNQTDIKDMLKNAGAFKSENQGSIDGVLYLKEEGKGGGQFDFALDHILDHDWREPIDFDISPVDNATNVLFYVKSQKTAHNHFNFGNFMFGAGGQALNLNLSTLLLGAHYNSLKNSGTNGYDGQLDSPDDQLSIGLGYSFGKKHNFNNITIDKNNKSDTKSESRAKF